MTSLTIIAWLTGITPPSAAPISSRAASSATNPPARPERNEQAQNITVDASRIGLRLPSRSLSGPTVSPATAQLSDRPEAIIPTWKLDSPRSGWICGIMKFAAWRSKNRMPKLRLSSRTSQVW